MSAVRLAAGRNGRAGRARLTASLRTTMATAMRTRAKERAVRAAPSRLRTRSPRRWPNPCARP
eukprot:8565712-Lingulodinium_polyedra.AAC.1